MAFASIFREEGATIMTARRILIGVCIIVFAFLVFAWRYWSHICTHRKVEVEAAAFGALLLLFVEDKGRMPQDMQELYREKYLEESSGDYAVPGPAAIGRRPEYGSSVHDIHFQFLSKMDIHFGGNGTDRPVLRVEGYSAANAHAERYSALIRLKLEEKKPAPD